MEACRIGLTPASGIALPRAAVFSISREPPTPSLIFIAACHSIGGEASTACARDARPLDPESVAFTAQLID